MGYIHKLEEPINGIEYEYASWPPKQCNCEWEEVLSDDKRVLETIDPMKYNLTFFKKVVDIEVQKLLKKSDSYLMEDYPLGDTTKEDVLSYRKNLRELPSKISEIPEKGLEGVVFPINPIKGE